MQQGTIYFLTKACNRLHPLRLGDPSIEGLITQKFHYIAADEAWRSGNALQTWQKELSLSTVITLDVEKCFEGNGRITLVHSTTAGGHTFCFDVRPGRMNSLPTEYTGALLSAEVIKVGSGIAEDVKLLSRSGLVAGAVRSCRDTQVIISEYASYIPGKNPARSGIDEISFCFTEEDFRPQDKKTYAKKYGALPTRWVEREKYL